MESREMELQEEVHQLRQMLDRARASLPDLKAAVVDQFAPRQTPRPEVLVALQLLASTAGLAAQCPNGACRRAGLCQSEDVCEPPCAAQWPEALSHQFEDMVAGIELSAWCAERRNAAIHARLTQLVEAPAPKRGKKRGR